MNKIILIGNLTRDPERAVTSGGISVAKFTLAVQRTYKNSDGERETDFINIVAFRGLAENCGQYLSKGFKAAVCGRMETRTYEVDGQKRYATEVIAEDVEFLSPKSNEAIKGQGEPQNASSGADNALKAATDDGLPF